MRAASYAISSTTQAVDCVATCRPTRHRLSRAAGAGLVMPTGSNTSHDCAWPPAFLGHNERYPTVLTCHAVLSLSTAASSLSAASSLRRLQSALCCSAIAALSLSCSSLSASSSLLASALCFATSLCTSGSSPRTVASFMAASLSLAHASLFAFSAAAHTSFCLRGSKESRLRTFLIPLNR